MKKLLLALVLMMAFFTTNAQNRSEIKGKIIDATDGQPLEIITISVSNAKDSSFVAYTSTTKNGEFHLKNMPSDKSIVLIASMMGYESFVKILNIKQNEIFDFGVIKMEFKSQSLGEVVITGERAPIVIDKDTINFNVEAFKVRSNAVVEELLKKLPGVQVDNDGTITYQGKNVSKLKVDGKEFFGNDPRLASKNLDADLLDKVQIYDDRENDPDHRIPDNEVSKIINLKFKRKFKKSTFGKFYVGGGTNDRFEAGGLYNMFRDTLQVSLIGVSNNLNKTGFSSNDLSQQGGFNRSGSNALYNGSVNIGGRSYGGIEQVASGGVNINNNYGTKLKLNLIYFYNNSRKDDLYSSYQEQYLSTDTLISRGTNLGNSDENKHSINGIIEWKPNKNITLRYTPTLVFSDKSSLRSNESLTKNTIDNISEFNGDNNQNNKNINFSHDIYYYKRLAKKGSSITIRHKLSLNNQDNLDFSNRDLISYSNNLNSEIIRRKVSDGSDNNLAYVEGLYTYPFGDKLTADFAVKAQYDNNGRGLLTYDKANENSSEYAVFKEDQSYDLSRNQFTENIKTGVIYRPWKNTRVELGWYTEWLQINNNFNNDIPDLNQNYFNILPYVNINFHKISLHYSASIQQPSIYDLQPNTIQSSQLYSFTGNPNLKPSKKHNINFGYDKYYNKSQFNFYVRGSSDFEENTTTSISTISNEGVSTSTVVNRNGKYFMYGSVGMGKRFKKVNNWQTTFNFNFNINKNHDFFIQNGNEGYRNNFYINQRISFDVNWKDKVVITPGYTITPRITNYTIANYEGQKFTTHNFFTAYTLRWPKRMYWEGNYAYQYNPNAGSGLQKSSNLLNISLALQMFKKDRGELKLSCYDILNQNINFYRYSGVNSRNDIQFTALKRYFLLTYLIKFNKTTTQ